MQRPGQGTRSPPYNSECKNSSACQGCGKLNKDHSEPGVPRPYACCPLIHCHADAALALLTMQPNLTGTHELDRTLRVKWPHSRPISGKRVQVIESLLFLQQATMTFAYPWSTLGLKTPYAHIQPALLLATLTCAEQSRLMSLL